jgi:Fe-S cluster assembly protein SufD
MASGTNMVGVDTYQALFAEAGPRLPGAGLPWLRDLRAQAIERFASAGFPHQKLESWKYTSLTPLARLAFAEPQANGRVDLPPPVLGPEAEARRVAIVDGRFRADLSAIGQLPAGVVLTSLADAFETHGELVHRCLGLADDLAGEPLLALNTALMADGLFLHVPAGVTLNAPIELCCISSTGGIAAHPRHLIVLEANAGATLVEQHVGGGQSYFSNVASDIVLEAGASLGHIKFQAEGGEAWHVALTRARIQRDATYRNFILSTGGRLARNEIRARLEGAHATCHLNGAYLGRHRQHLDHTTLVDHVSPDASSRQTYHGVLDDHARGVFQGHVLVRPDAQRTDGYQLNRAVLLSETAEIDSKPMLEIYADDVKCSHGATAGALDEAAQFYLRARGIPDADARRLLIEGFVATVIDMVEPDAAREAARARVAAWLGEAW